MPKVRKQSVRASKKVVKKKPRISPRDKGVVGRICALNPEGTGLKINLYGRSGTGKTTLWATFPKPILALLCSGSDKPGELRSIDTPEYRRTIQQVVLREPMEVQEIAEYQRSSGKFKTVVLDHATGLQDLVLKEILGLDSLPAQKSWGMAKQQDWGQCAVQMKELLRALLGLDCHVVVVAQEREFNTEGSDEMIMPFVASALTPSVVGWLNPACDYICNTFIRQKESHKEMKVGKKVVKTKVKSKEVEYCLRTAPDPVFTTKFRLPKGRALPECIVDPSYRKIAQLIGG